MYTLKNLFTPDTKKPGKTFKEKVKNTQILIE